MTDPRSPHDENETAPAHADDLLDRHLDSLLQAIDDVPVSAQLQRRIAEIPLRHPRATEPTQWLSWISVWKSATVAVVICALGAWAGASDVAASVIDEPVTATYSDDDGLALAFGISADEDTTP
jgi:hypothetical protein